MADTITPDLCVIGAGLGGLACVAEARALGASVVLVERGRLGGDYLNAGAVPSRALAAAAAHAHAIRTAAAFGIAADEPRVHSRKVHDTVQRVIAALAAVESAPRLAALGVDIVRAEAKFVDPRTVVAGDTLIRARRFVIATGTQALVPALPGIDAIPYFTGDTIFDNTRKLTHLLVIGGTAVALEIAQSHARLGSAVTVVTASPPLAGADPELAAIALQRMREEGVEIRENTLVEAIQGRSQGIGVLIRSGEAEARLDVSHVLVADARIPDLDALDLEKAGIRRSKADPRLLEVTAQLRTSNRRVYALGEAVGAGLAHLSAMHGRRAARHALLGLLAFPPADLQPSVVFTDPELAEVGLTEAEARARYGDGFRVLRAGFAECDRARATQQGYGLAKLVIGRDGRILGAGIAGDRAGELIGIFTLALTRKLALADLRGFVAPGTTMAGIIPRLVEDGLRDSPANPLWQRLAGLLRYLP